MLSTIAISARREPSPERDLPHVRELIEQDEAARARLRSSPDIEHRGLDRAAALTLREFADARRRGRR
jgi:hypothetical protein